MLIITPLTDTTLEARMTNHYTTDTTLEARMLIITPLIPTRGKNANHYTTDTTLEARILIITH